MKLSPMIINIDSAQTIAAIMMTILILYEISHQHPGDLQQLGSHVPLVRQSCSTVHVHVQLHSSGPQPLCSSLML
jgi:hypothetical protein